MILLLASFCLTGCVSRRVTIRSEPGNALVLVDGEEVGYTPVAVDFTYYGTREITLIKDGYETLTVMQEIRSPWYQKFPLEFFSDNFLLGHATDRHTFTYQMRPQKIAPTQDLLNRAKGLRSESQVGGP